MSPNEEQTQMAKIVERNIHALLQRRQTEESKKTRKVDGHDGEDFGKEERGVELGMIFQFVMMEMVDSSNENPFENGINHVPVTALCRTAEIDLRKMWGETDLPEKPKPVNDILM